MNHIDPSELRETSNLLQHISDVPYQPCPGLEALTGADLMVSPDGLPKPGNDKLILYHIKQGAKLIQLKFGHDLPASIVDSRLNESLSRMLKTGAMSWQCLLLFVGIFSYDDSKGMATINGQLSYSDPPMTWKSVQAALTFWAERGGTLDFPLASGKLMAKHLAIHQSHLNRFREGETTKTLWPTRPAYYEEVDSNNELLREWKTAQKIKVIDDIRVLIRAIPDANIGPEKATAILEYMRLNGHREDFSGFLELLEGDVPKLLEIAGIGKKTFNNVMRGLWWTREQREANRNG